MNAARTNQPRSLADWALQSAARDLHCANRLDAQQQPESAANMRYQAGMLIAAGNAAIAVQRTQIGPLDD